MTPVLPVKRAAALLLAFTCTAVAQDWITYNGDDSGRRFSPLAQINRENASSLTLAWAFQVRAGTLKSTPLEVGGVLYFATPDNVWATDARTGRQIWHFHRESEGNHLANRGVAILGTRLFFGTPDAHVICLNARNGAQLWDTTVADVAFGYYLSLAPLVVKGNVIIGTSGDQADVPHFIEALSPEDGKVVWRFDTVPKPGTLAARSWPNAQAMAHGGGPAWVTGTYDPELNLVFWGTGNPHPVLAGETREGANLYTCSIVALDADTGKLVWSFQPSPHDTHDWDAVETPVLFDADWEGRPRKLLAQASRNGYFFVLDRTNGKDLLTSRFVDVDWAAKINVQGEPVAKPEKQPEPDGSLVRAYTEGATNWQAPSFDPQTGLFYVNAEDGFTIYYLTLDENGRPDSHQGGLATPLIGMPKLVAIDYKTGAVKWRRDEPQGFGHPGILTTAGGVLITGDVSGNLLVLDPETGKTLWHRYLGGVLNSSPMTYEYRGRQYILTGVDGVLYAWALPEKEE